MYVKSPDRPVHDQLAISLLQHSSLLTRLAFRQAHTDMSRSEASILATLGRGPQRITALAEQEGLAQPTVTVLVRDLEGRGYVKRERDLADGRVVLASLTEAGERALAAFRDSYRPLLVSCLAALPSAQLEALEAAEAALGTLIELLQEAASR
ncbi:MAG: MarR family winged helix-turn-helix transcriptional regulator [Solirubrobacterales bacterium]